jgi:peptidoglycan/xylan/chitin deacetylase (PgdA/CDA1 family)
MGSHGPSAPRGLKSRLLTALVRAPIPTSDPRRRVVVLLYHSVHPDKGFASATPELFGEHMRWLVNHCDLIPFEHVLTAAAGARHDRPRVALTFDDGYADVHEFAMPVLERLEIPATFFLTIGLTRGDETTLARMAHLQGSSTDDVRGLSWEQVRELRDAGMRFGCHGINHVNLAAADDAEVRREATTAKEELERRLGTTVTLFAYPFGKPKHHYTERTSRIIASCGFHLAGTTTFGRVRATTDPLALPRISVTMDPIDMLRAKVEGKLDLVGTYQRHTPRWAARIISPGTSTTS